MEGGGSISCPCLRLCVVQKTLQNGSCAAVSGPYGPQTGQARPKKIKEDFPRLEPGSAAAGERMIGVNWVILVHFANSQYMELNKICISFFIDEKILKSMQLIFD